MKDYEEWTTGDILLDVGFYDDISYYMIRDGFGCRSYKIAVVSSFFTIHF